MVDRKTVLLAILAVVLVFWGICYGSLYSTDVAPPVDETRNRQWRQQIHQRGDNALYCAAIVTAAGLIAAGLVAGSGFVSAAIVARGANGIGRTD